MAKKQKRPEQLPEQLLPGLSSLTDAARRNGISIQTAHSWARRGRLKVRGRYQGRLIVSERDLTERRREPARRRGPGRKGPSRSPDGLYLIQETGERTFDQDAAAMLLLEDGVLRLGFNQGAILLQLAPCPGIPGCTQAPERAQLEQLTLQHVADTKWGALKWRCNRAGQRPGPSTQERMQADGAWDQEMEQLPSWEQLPS